MSARESAMRPHPSGQHVPHTPDRIQALIDAAHDQEAMDVANRERADLDAWAGGPLYRVNEKHHEVSKKRHAWLLELLPPAGIAVFIIVVCWLYGVAKDFLGWWLS